MAKVSQNRPFALKTKVGLIQEDNEKFRNHLHSISKFNRYKGKVEH